MVSETNFQHLSARLVRRPWTRHSCLIQSRRSGLLLSCGNAAAADGFHTITIRSVPHRSAMYTIGRVLRSQCSRPFIDCP